MSEIVYLAGTMLYHAGRIYRRGDVIDVSDWPREVLRRRIEQRRVVAEHEFDLRRKPFAKKAAPEPKKRARTRRKGGEG